MGMYTEINMRANLRQDTPEEVLQVLEAMAFGAPILAASELPAHPLFESHRWYHLGVRGSYYFPKAGLSEVVRPVHEWDAPRFSLHGDLKNYDNEIDKFFDWIDPYIDAEPGEFLGYSLYEEDQCADGSGPVLRVKGGVAEA